MGNKLSTTTIVGVTEEDGPPSDLELSGGNSEEVAQEELDAKSGNLEDEDGDETEEEEEKEVIEVYLRQRSETSLEQQIRQLELQYNDLLEQVRANRIEVAEVRALYEEYLAEIEELKEGLREVKKKQRENDIFLLKVVVVGLLTGALLGVLLPKRK